MCACTLRGSCVRKLKLVEPNRVQVHRIEGCKLPGYTVYVVRLGPRIKLKFCGEIGDSDTGKALFIN
jgi:hypothetical protein